MRNAWEMFVTVVLSTFAVIVACFVGLLALVSILMPAIVAAVVCFAIYLGYRYVEAMP